MTEKLLRKDTDVVDNWYSTKSMLKELGFSYKKVYKNKTAYRVRDLLQKYFKEGKLSRKVERSLDSRGHKRDIVYYSVSPKIKAEIFSAFGRPLEVKENKKISKNVVVDKEVKKEKNNLNLSLLIPTYIAAIASVITMIKVVFM